LPAVGPNVLGVTENPVVSGSGLHRGTSAGVYGDTGIFYATDRDTAFGSWQAFTSDPVGNCGSATAARQLRLEGVLPRHPGQDDHEQQR
ncbi:MAG: hypothetical protein ABI780_10635, partial [Ardenticatenales bacterium]